MLLFKIIGIKILLLYLAICALCFIYRILLRVLVSKKTTDYYKTICNALLEGYYIPNKYKWFLKPGNLELGSGITTVAAPSLKSQLSKLYKTWSKYWKNEIFNSMFNVVNCVCSVTSAFSQILAVKKSIKNPK
jgi:hypothetical protein